MAALNRTDAQDRARQWVERVAPGAEPVLFEFDLGWVISARFPPSAARRLGVPSMVLNRETGELEVGGTLPPEDIAEWYSRGFESPHVSPEPERREKMAKLIIGERSWFGIDRPPDDGRFRHPIVTTFFKAMPAQYREPGVEFSAEAFAFSDMFLAEENARAEAGLPRLTLPTAREVVRGARLQIFPDPLSGTRTPSLPILLFLDFLGLSPAAAEIRA